MRKSAENGATVYVRGGLAPGGVYSLNPFSDQRFEFSINLTEGYYFSTNPLLPVAIAKEQISARVIAMPQALGLDDRARALVSSGTGLPAIFSLEVGAGQVIFDLHSDDNYDEKDLVAKLADPYTRAASIGALAAVDWVAGRDAARPAPVNLVIDDRPTNYDYLNAGQLDAFLNHVESNYPGIHVDFAWTPGDTRPHSRYIEVLRRHNTGFVWHGFLRHIDHREIDDYETHLRQGRACSDEIERKFGVQFQPVMIFPFEKDTPHADSLLRRSGFVAKVRSAAGLPPASYYRLAAAGDDRFRVIFRDSVEVMTRDQMLALATLGMPIIALAHPRDLSLRRLGRRDPSAMSYFDSVVKFVAEKSLRPMSLAEIAAEVPADPR
ncbi:MAG TPA: hypothetical protein VGR40_04685 [Candidatus Binatus sp.]|nr:hypothetical protein [Candidatus Binatus sp.]